MWHVIRLRSPATVASDFARPSLPKIESLVRGGQVVSAEVGNQYGSARGIAGRGGVFTIGHLAKGLASPLARFVGCQDSDTPEGELSRPTSRISVLHNPSPRA